MSDDFIHHRDCQGAHIDPFCMGCELAKQDALYDRIEQLEEALFESMALNINYHSVEENDGYQFTEAPAVIEMARAALEGKKDER